MGTLGYHSQKNALNYNSSLSRPPYHIYDLIRPTQPALNMLHQTNRHAK